MNIHKPYKDPIVGTNPRKDTEALAIASFRKSVKIRPTFLPSYQALIKIFRRNKNNYELKETYLNMSAQFGLKADFAENLCAITSDEGFITDALRYCTQAIKLNPKSSASYAYLALSHYDKGEKNEAREILAKATRRFPNSFIVNGTLGEILYQEKSYKMAIKHLKRAAKLNKKSTRVQLALAHSLFETGKYKAALSSYLKSCRIDNQTVTALKVASSKLNHANKRDLASVYKSTIEKCYKK